MQKIDQCFKEIEKEVIKYWDNIRDIRVSTKNKGEVVSNVDKEIENVIRQVINRFFKNHSIIWEELGSNNKNDEYIWHIDPIDNTVGFVSWETEISTSVALKHLNNHVHSIVINPRTHEIFMASKLGSFKNGNPVYPFQDDIENKSKWISMCSYVNPTNLIRIQSIIWKIFQEKYPLRISWWAALDLCRVAEGVRAAHISLGAHSWDIEAGLHIVKQAGGVVEILTRYPERNSIAFIASANEKIHTRIKDLLGEDIRY